MPYWEGVDMKDKSIYQLAREVSGLTQERAAEYLNIATETIASYEQGRRKVPDDIVFAMSELYQHPILCYKHLRLKATAKELPDVEVRSLSQAVIMLLKNIDDLEENRNSILRIAYDNKIDENELNNWCFILDQIAELQKACFTVKYCRGERG